MKNDYFSLGNLLKKAKKPFLVAFLLFTLAFTFEAIGQSPGDPRVTGTSVCEGPGTQGTGLVVGIEPVPTEYAQNNFALYHVVGTTYTWLEDGLGNNIIQFTEVFAVGTYEVWSFPGFPPNPANPTATGTYIGARYIWANPTISGVSASASSVCFGQSVSFTATGLVDGETTFNITVDDGSTSTTQDQTVTVTGGSYLFPAVAYPVGSYDITINSATKNGCLTNFTSNNTTSFTVNAIPVFSSVSLQYSFNQSTGPWEDVSGNSATGFSMCIHPDWNYFYLDVDEFNSTPDINAEHLNGFKLDYANLPVSNAEWEAYWALKGVTSGGPGWDIITGVDPIFYLYKTAAGDYQIIDAFLLDVAGQGMNPLRVDGDYPQGNYNYIGAVASGSANCESLPITISLSFQHRVLNLTQEKVYCDIQPAIAAANANDEIHVAAGTYNENVSIGTTINLSGTVGKTAIIDGGGSGTVVAITANNVQMSGFTIQNSGSTPLTDGGIILTGASGCTIQDNDVINNNSLGIAMQYSSGNTILTNTITNNYVAAVALIASTGNTIQGNNASSTQLVVIPGSPDQYLGYGIVLEEDGGNASTGNSIIGNTVNNNTSDGIYFGQGSNGNYIINGNTVSGNERDGIYFWKSSNNEIINNTIVGGGTTWNGIHLMGSSSNTINGNTTSGNTDCGIRIRCGAESSTGNIIQYNSITANATGIDLIDDVSTNNYVGIVNGNTISYNDIVGNTLIGMTTTDTPVLELYAATHNWWGDVGGPGTGGANDVSSNIVYCPWLDGPHASTPGTVGIVQLVSTGDYYCNLTDAIADAGVNDQVNLLADITENIVVLNKVITLDGGGFTLTSTSANYGISVQSEDVTIQNITVTGAGTFGIHQSSPDHNNLALTNVTTNANGGTGIALNCATGNTLTTIVSTNNGGNGVSITDCSDLTIDGITTSGNLFQPAGEFGAGIGIFTNGDNGCPDVCSNISISNSNLNDVVAIYEQAIDGIGTISGVTFPTDDFTHYMGIYPGNKYYYTGLTEALAAADFTLALNVAYQPYIYVKEVGGTDLYVAKATTATVDMSIKAAILAALPDDIINVYAGEFTEAGQIVVDKDLTITGDGIGSTILYTDMNTASSGDDRGWWLVETGIRLDLSGMTLNGSGYLVYQGVRQKGYGSFNEVHFTNILFNESGPTYGGTAVAAFGTGNVHITNSVFDNIGRVGVLYFGATITGSNYSGNVYTGKGVGDWLDYALDISAGAVVNVDDNTISLCRGVASSDGSTSGAVLVTTFFGPGTIANVTNNTLTNNSTAVLVGYDENDVSTVTVTNNFIEGNDYGVTSVIQPVNAENNWWGDATGPFQDPNHTCGNGDEVSGPVDFIPWCTDIDCTGSTSGDALAVENVTTGKFYCKIQDAIDDPLTEPGCTIVVQPGLYEENVVITKALRLVGPNESFDCDSRVAEAVVAPTSGVPFTITADGVTLLGFEITAPASPNAIVCGGTSSLNIGFNNIHDIGTTVSGSNVHSIQYSLGAAITSGVTVSDNCFAVIGNVSNGYRSTSAIGFLDSGATGTLTTLNVERNTIEYISANTSGWGDGGRIAYGIIINTGGNSSYLTNGKVVDAAIKNNEISNLNGFISTGIALEGNTEDAIVEYNSVSLLFGNKDGGLAGGGYDLQALKFEANRYVGTCIVRYNSFNANTFVNNTVANRGYAIANYVPVGLVYNGTEVTGPAITSCNWHGTAVLADIVPNATYTGKIYNKTDCETNFLPYWTVNGGPCDGIGPVVNISTGNSYVTIQDAIDNASTTVIETLEVSSGLYNEQVTIDRAVVINGVGTTQPIVNVVGLASNAHIMQVAATNVTINNLHFEVDDANGNLLGISTTATTTFDGLTVNNCLFETLDNDGDPNPNWNSAAIQLGTFGGPGGAISDGVTITNNTMQVGSSATSHFTRGIRTWNIHGDFTGNTIEAYYALQMGDPAGGIVNISNNPMIKGALELNNLEAGHMHIVDNNVFDVAEAYGASTDFAAIELKNNSQTGVSLEITNNVFQNHPYYGIFSGRSAGVHVEGNDFTAAGASFTHVHINTKHRTSSFPSVAFSSDMTLLNNTFNGNGTSPGGIALELANHDNVCDFGDVIIGNVGNENEFASYLDFFIRLNDEVGTTTGHPIWGTLQASTMSKVDQDFDIANNMFDVGSGLQLPANMDFTQRTALEGGLFHQPDDLDLGLLTYFLPVANLTQITSYLTIAEAISNANANDVIELQGWTFNERVVIDKSLTLQGVSEDNCIIDGSTFGTNGDGIFIQNGITDVTIQYLTIQNFAGSGGNSDAGIYANAGNNNLNVNHVTIQDNVGGSGFYANGPIDNVTLDYVTSSGHTTGARGIVIWNGLKSNITITNCEVFNNNCCGIELQDGTASGVNMSNNFVHNNGDNGMSAVGLTSGSGANTINDNVLVDNGRFGIEIKNPDGTGATTGDGSIVVSGNNVSMTAGIADLRDMGGILVFRRGVLAGNVDIPTGVVVQGNTVSGYVQPSDSDGFGIVIEGINHTLSGNILNNNDVGTQQQAGHLPYPGDGDQNNLLDEYFGRGNSPYSCGNNISANTYTGNTVDHRDVPGSLATTGTVTNTNTGLVYCSIQAAIDDGLTENGHTIEVGPGIYEQEWIYVYKSVEIHGPNYGLAGTSTSRGPEAVLRLPDDTEGWSGIMYIVADDVVVDGFTISDEGGLPDHEFTGIFSYLASNVQISNNIVDGFNYISLWMYGDGYPALTPKVSTVTNNYLMNNYGLYHTIYLQGIGGTVSGNTVENGSAALQIQPYGQPNGGSVQNNTFNSLTSVMYHNYASLGSGKWTYTNNSVSAVLPPPGDKSATIKGMGKRSIELGLTIPKDMDAAYDLTKDAYDWIGIYVRTHGTSGSGAAPEVEFNTDNDVDGTIALSDPFWADVIGLQFRNTGNNALTKFYNNDITNVDYGIKVYDDTNNGSLVDLDDNTLSNYNFAILVEPDMNVDASSGNTYNGVASSSATLAELFVIEDAIVHKIDESTRGLVSVTTDELYVTEYSFAGAETAASIQRGIDAASGLWTVNVNDGNYTGNLVVNKELDLLAANAGLATITGAGGTAISVQSDYVEINGFTITNPDGPNAIVMDGFDYLEVRNNIITGIGNNLTSGNTHALTVTSNGGEVNTVTIEDNTFSDIHGGENDPAISNGSASAIAVGWTNSANNVNGLLIQNNTITNVNASIIPWASGNLGGKGAYGILFSVGAAGAGQIVDADILNNDISYLEGHWAHAIGLEGDTPGAEVYDNDISFLTDYKDPSDAVAVLIEDNASAGSVLINNNSFTDLEVGVWNKEAVTVNATCNYWGSDISIDVEDMVVGDVQFLPYTTVSPGGLCDGLGPVVNTTQGWSYMTIQAAVDEATSGDAITVATGVYEEQVYITVNNISITGEGVGNTVILSPVELPLFYSTSSDNYPIVFIDGVTEVLISELTVDGANRGDDNYRFQGIGFWNSGGTLSNASVVNVMDATFGGFNTQHGVGIYAYNDLGGPYTITMNNVLVDGYQKGGIAMNGTGLTANLTNVTTIGEGPTTVTAQNGIQFYGSGGTITDCNVTGNIYTGSGWAASGALLLSHELVTITNSHFGDNDPNVYNQEGDIIISGGTITNTLAEAGNGFYNRISTALPAKGSAGEFEFKDASPYDALDLKGYTPKGTMSAQISGCVLTGAGSGYGISASNYVAADVIDIDATNCTITNWGWGLVVFGSGGEVSLDIDESEIYGNGGGFYSDAAIATKQNAYNNWWGFGSGPYNDPDNLCGEGNAVIGDIDFSPWYYDASMSATAVNGVIDVTLSDIPNINTVTNVPLVLTSEIVYPDGLTNFNPDILVDAFIASDVEFPAGATVVSVNYNGTPVLGADFDLSGLDEVYLSEILGLPATPAFGHNDLTITWEIIIEGFDIEETYSIDLSSVSYILDKETCNNVLATDNFVATFADAIVAIDAPANGCDDEAVFTVDMTYPLIENISTDILTDALITSSLDLTGADVLSVTYNGGANLLGTPYSLMGTQVYLSDILGGPAYPLQGHVDTDTWEITVGSMNPEVYDITIEAIARLGADEYSYASDITSMAFYNIVVGLSATPDISTATSTPVIISQTVTHPVMPAYGNEVLEDARITSDIPLPNGATIISITYDGGETLAVPYVFDGSLTEVYLSDILGGAYPLTSESGATNDWEITLVGIDNPGTYHIYFESLAYVTKGECEAVMADDDFLLTYADAEMVIVEDDVYDCGPDFMLDFTVEMTYPTIANMNPTILTNSLITSDIALPAGTVIDWNYNSGMASGSYELLVDTDEIDLATIVGSQASLQGHVGTDTWLITLTVADEASYEITIAPFAELGVVDYPYGGFDIVNVSFWDQPIAVAGDDDDICISNYATEGYTLQGVASFGDGLWEFVAGPAAVVDFDDETQATTTVYVSEAGEYTFSWTETNGDCNSTDEVVITFNSNPTPVISGSANVIGGSTVVYSVVDAGNNYDWVVTGAESYIESGNICEVIWGNGILGNVQVTETIVATGCFITVDLEVTIDPIDLQGVITYNNNSNTPMNNVTVRLTDGGTYDETTTTDINGRYSFDDLVDATAYTLEVETPKAWGGGNSTDALAIQRTALFYVFPWWNPANFLNNVADVNNSGTILTSDALLVKKRTVYLINSFDAGDWAFWIDDVNFTNTADNIANVSYTHNGTAALNIEAMCYGDVNGSYLPPATKSFSSVEGDEITFVADDKQFELPVQLISGDYNIGAMTIHLSFDDYLVDVKSLKTTIPDLLYSIEDGFVNVAWSDINPLDVPSGGTLFTLVLEAKENIDSNDELFLLSSESQFADSYAKVLSDVHLSINKVDAKVNGSSYGLEANYAISCFPNPVKDILNISYSLPENGQVEITIMNSMGDHVTKLVDAPQETGKYNLTFNPANYGLATGVYYCRMLVQGENSDYTEAIRVVYMK
jgi:parallel beta-helix repeat protein